MTSCSKKTEKSGWPRFCQPRQSSRSITGSTMSMRRPRSRSIWVTWFWSTSWMNSPHFWTKKVGSSQGRQVLKTSGKKNQRWKYTNWCRTSQSLPSRANDWLWQRPPTKSTHLRRGPCRSEISTKAHSDNRERHRHWVKAWETWMMFKRIWKACDMDYEWSFVDDTSWKQFKL